MKDGQKYPNKLKIDWQKLRSTQPYSWPDFWGFITDGTWKITNTDSEEYSIANYIKKYSNIISY